MSDSEPQGNRVEVIRIIFTMEDVREIADENDIPFDVAKDRALDWGRHIADTMRGYCSEQLESVIIRNVP